MKLCILIIFSYTDYYEKMAEILTKYYSRFANVSHYFIVSREDQSSHVEVEENYIYVKCPETMMNILRKTVASMKYVLEIGGDFDYLVRSNISTLVNVPKLMTYLEPISRTNFYGGGQSGKIDWVTMKTENDAAGVNDYVFFGTQFFQGTSILFSKDVVQYMCDNCDKFKYTIIDDVSIGIFMRFHQPNIYASAASNILQVTNIWIPHAYIQNTKNEKINSYCFVVNNTFDDILEKAVFYRNKSSNRFDDVFRMRKLANILMDSIR